MSWTTLLTSAVVAAVVAGVFTLINNRVTLYTTYKLEQKKELKNLIGDYHGRMLEAARDWDRRMRRLYEPKGTDHMAPHGGCYDHEEYLYLSVVFRFLSLLGIARKFESHAFYIDSRIAQRNDLYFLRYAKSFLWVMTDSNLTPDDGMPARDHFLNDEFRPLLDICYRRQEGVLPENEPKEGELVFDWQRFLVLLDESRPPENDDNQHVRVKHHANDGLDPDIQKKIRQVLGFFDGIRPHEYDDDNNKRRRWERIICLHLLTICFIGTFGYPWEKKKQTIDKSRGTAIIALKNEAAGTTGNQISVLKAFRDNLYLMTGMDGQEQIKRLEHDLTEAIGNPPPRLGR
jgi:hypothetical protein